MRAYTRTRRSASAYGSAFSSTDLTTPKTAAFAPMPSASVTIASSENSGARTAERTPIPQILPQVVEPVATGHGAALLREQLRALVADARHVAEALERRRTCRDGVHAARHVIAHALLEVERELAVDFDLWLGLEGTPAATTVAFLQFLTHGRSGHRAQLGARVVSTA